jgi:hypothetical protein
MIGGVGSWHYFAAVGEEAFWAHRRGVAPGNGAPGKPSSTGPRSHVLSRRKQVVQHMGFRNPMYLDVPLLKNLADYYGIDVPTPRQVTQRTSGSTGKGLGINSGVTVHLDSDRAVETTETFSTDFRPIRLVNDVIDSLLQSRDVINLVEDQTSNLISQSPIQIEGELTMSPATEIGSLVGGLFPLMIARYSEGETDPAPSQEDLVQLLTAPQTEGAQVYDLNLSDTGGRNFVLILDPRNVAEGRDCDDLEGEFTVFGIIDRLLSETSSLSLTRYLLPGMSRTMRRAIGKTSLDELIAGFGEVSGQQIDAQALNVSGPGAVIKPLAIY